MEALNHILSLRINDLKLINENIRILSGIFISDTENNLENLIKQVIESKEQIYLIPLNLYNKHATGLIFDKSTLKGNHPIEAIYFDS